jgi:antitoxin (DNA-binding transcriptional repressor) of toxin-antitoxin stability system
MVTVGIRELKNRLSKYLRLVRNGELVQVTDRGTVVAEIRAPGTLRQAEQLPEGLLELARRQKLTLGLANEDSLYPVGKEPLLRGISSAELLDADRGER